MRFRTISSFSKRWKKIGGTKRDLDTLIDYLRERGPKDIELVSKYTRIVRSGIEGRGKRGGARIIYFAEIRGYVFFLGCYDRRKKSRITKQEKAVFDAICEELMKRYQ